MSVFCKNCEHFRSVDHFCYSSLCARPISIEPDPVYGLPDKLWKSAAWERAKHKRGIFRQTRHCGPCGIYFRAKPEEMAAKKK